MVDCPVGRNQEIAMSRETNEKLLAQMTSPIQLRAIKWTSGGSLDVPHTYGGDGPITYQIQMEAVDGSVFVVPFNRQGLERFVEALTGMLEHAQQHHDEAPPPKKAH
jgi:hypothetical protein